MIAPLDQENVRPMIFISISPMRPIPGGRR
jgi:hypothetical protein